MGVNGFRVNRIGKIFRAFATYSHPTLPHVWTLPTLLNNDMFFQNILQSISIIATHNGTLKMMAQKSIGMVLFRIRIASDGIEGLEHRGSDRSRNAEQ
jgi:hypothetical protein